MKDIERLNMAMGTHTGWSLTECCGLCLMPRMLTCKPKSRY